MLKVLNETRSSDFMTLEAAWYLVYNVRLEPPNEHMHVLLWGTAGIFLMFHIPVQLFSATTSCN